VKLSSVNFQIETTKWKKWGVTLSHMTTCHMDVWFKWCLYLGIFPICKTTFTSKILDKGKTQIHKNVAAQRQSLENGLVSHFLQDFPGVNHSISFSFAILCVYISLFNLQIPSFAWTWISAWMDLSTVGFWHKCL
jgi:hypothetical protein